MGKVTDLNGSKVVSAAGDRVSVKVSTEFYTFRVGLFYGPPAVVSMMEPSGKTSAWLYGALKV